MEFFGLCPIRHGEAASPAKQKGAVFGLLIFAYHPLKYRPVTALALGLRGRERSGQLFNQIRVPIQ